MSFPESQVGSDLASLEKMLQKPDAILEPGIFSVLKDYVVKGGDPRKAIDMLTESFVGYAAKASLMCSWLRTLDGDVASMDEAYFLRNLILERFDPRRFSGIFAKGGSGAPTWLSALIQDPGGRHLIYELSSRYHNSLFLNFAIQKILQTPGREQELLDVGASLIGVFPQFQRLLEAQLISIAAASDSQLIEKVTRQLGETLGRCEHAYVYVQLVLSAFVADQLAPWSPRFARVAQELEKYGQKSTPWRTRGWLTPTTSEEKATDSVGWLLADILGTKATLPPSLTTVTALHTLYSAPLEQRPSPLLLRHPLFIQSLLRGLFASSSSSSLVPPTPHAHLLAVATTTESQGDVDQVARDLDTVASLWRRLVGAGKGLTVSISPEQVCLLQGAATKHRVVFYGVLEAMTNVLSGGLPGGYGDRRSIGFLPIVEALARAAAATGPHGRREFLSFIGHTCTLSDSEDMCQGLLNSIVSFALTGWADEALDWVGAALRDGQPLASMRPAAVRAFFFNFIERAGPPYSWKFAEIMLRLADKAGVRKRDMPQREWTMRLSLVTEFTRGCLEAAQGRDHHPFLHQLAQLL